MDTRTRSLGLALLAAAAAVVAQPAPVLAQAEAQAAEAPSVSDERLTTYAELFLAISAARDEFQASKAAVHDSEARHRIREEMDERLSGLYEEHGMAKDEYDGITFMVSIDSDLRTRLDQLLETMRAPDSES